MRRIIFQSQMRLEFVKTQKRQKHLWVLNLIRNPAEVYSEML